MLVDTREASWCPRNRNRLAGRTPRPTLSGRVSLSTDGCCLRSRDGGPVPHARFVRSTRQRADRRPMLIPARLASFLPTDPGGTAPHPSSSHARTSTPGKGARYGDCLLYTSDAADE